MSRWNTLPYELLLKIHELACNNNVIQNRIQFQLVCKQWEACAPYSAFSHVFIGKLERLSSLVMLILSNPKIGFAVDQLILDNILETEEIQNSFRRSVLLNQDEVDIQLFDSSAQEFERSMEETYVTLLTILFRHLPKLTYIRFSTENMPAWYDVINVNAAYLRRMKTITPPSSFREIPSYSSVAWAFRHTLEKVTVVDTRNNTDPLGSYLSRLCREIECFPKLEELRLELVEENFCNVNSLEYLVDNTPLLEAFEISFTCAPLSRSGASKLDFSAIDLSTVKPCYHIEKFRTIDCVLQNDNAIEYIIRKFPALRFLIYKRSDSDPWYIGDWNIPDVPQDLSLKTQKNLFKYLKNVHYYDIYLLVLKEETSRLLSLWDAIMNKVKDKFVVLELQNEFQVIENGAYVYFQRLEFSRHNYCIKAYFHEPGNWSYTPIVASLGRCLDRLIINDLRVDSEMLIQIYRACPVLNNIDFYRIIIDREIDTRGVTNAITVLEFIGLDASSVKWIPGITRSMPNLHFLSIIQCDITTPKEDDIHQIQDLHFSVTSSWIHCFKLEVKHSILPPWCFIVNNRAFVNTREVIEGIATKNCFAYVEIGIEEVEQYKSKLPLVEREYSYCIHFECRKLEFFELINEYNSPTPSFENENFVCKLPLSYEDIEFDPIAETEREARELLQ